MRFNPRQWRMRLLLCSVLVLAGLLLGSCEDDIPNQNEIDNEAAQRIERNILPSILDESAVVLQYLVNFMAALPELCSTPMAQLGSFTSSLPALQQAVQNTQDLPRLDDDLGEWRITWRDVALGDEDGLVDPQSPLVDITVRIVYRSEQADVLRAVPFSLVPVRDLQTVGEPPSYDPAPDPPTIEGFFLSQDATTGVWTLRWRALGTAKVFAAQISAASGVSRVMRRLPESTPLTSLVVDNTSTRLSFRETTAPEDVHGISFYTRPGEIIRFALSIGTSQDTLEDITREQLRIGAQDQLLPAELDPAEFSLSSNVPFDPVGEPGFLPGQEIGTFLWQDITSNACNAGEDQWRLRFNTADNLSVTFSGELDGVQENNARALLRATPVGDCPAAMEEREGTRLSYTCTVTNAQERGYDVCVSAGRGVRFSPEVNALRDPGRVFLGARRMPPPSPDPFAIFFEFDLTEKNSARNVRFTEARMVMRGNNAEEGSSPLNEDLVSEEPFCSNPQERVQPRVRLTELGDYETERFEGSRYVLEDVEFADSNVTTLDDTRRFPDRGLIRLETRVEGDDVDVEVPLRDVRLQDGRAQALVDIEFLLNQVVMFRFEDRPLFLSGEE